MLPIMAQSVFLTFKYQFRVMASNYKLLKNKHLPNLTLRRDIRSATNAQALLIGVRGVLYEYGTDEAIEGSVEAIERLRKFDMPFKLITNESMSTRATLAKKLQSFGFDISEKEIFSPGIATRAYIEKNKLRPFLLIHPDLLPEFDGCDQSSPNCVVVGNTGEHFSFKDLNKAFNILMKVKNPQLITMGYGKYYKENDELVMDIGGIHNVLQYATDIRATVIGKPAFTYYFHAIESFAIKPDKITMIGDCMYSDVCGAQHCSIRGVIVKTGKFREKDMTRFVRPDAVVNNLAHFVDMLCSAQREKIRF